MFVRKLRLRRGWSQEQLAQMSGLSVRTVQRIERNQGCSVGSLKSLAAVFEVEFTTLIRASEMTNETDKISADEEIAI
jgi:transcriptional regulator with XRE-family HTH domain